MKEIVYCVAIICLSTSIVHGSEVKALCDNDWHTYQDEKCVKLFEILANRHQAEEICHQHGATLVQIKSAAEQKFLTQLVLNATYLRSVWIGAERQQNNETEFNWSDGIDFDLYSNWAEGRPSADIRRTCVHMQSSQLSYWEWTDSACTTEDWFICQKLQNWSLEYLQQAILVARREMERNINSFTEQTAKMNAELKYLQDNPIPVGFVYVQLRNQPEPSIIWDSVEWSEITTQYAGLFFRVEGGGSAPFGWLQEDTCPRLRTIQRQNTNSVTETHSVLSPGIWGPLISTGATGIGTHWALQFIVTGDETRPRNTAMRIWIRTN